MKAAQRDASWWNNPSKNGGKYHVVLERGRPACGLRALLTIEHARDASDVPTPLQCQRSGCRQRWPRPVAA